MRNLLLITITAISICSCSNNSIPVPVLSNVGWLEQVVVSPAKILMHAKLDTGADNCSVNAQDIEHFQQKDENWIRFTLANRYGDSEKIEAKVIRTAKIKTKKKGFQSRPVIKLGICLDSIFKTIECNLVDRSHFDYPILIGRNFLAGSVLVDSSETYLTQPLCKAK